jgi:hypothetical protein
MGSQSNRIGKDDEEIAKLNEGIVMASVIFFCLVKLPESRFVMAGRPTDEEAVCDGHVLYNMQLSARK